MRAHHQQFHPDAAMPAAYAPQRVRRAAFQDANSKNLRKRDHEKAVRQARNDRFKNGTATQDDYAYRKMEKERALLNRQKKKAAAANNAETAV